MQKELQAAGDAGLEHCGQSVFRKTLGVEMMVILERDREQKPRLWEYKLLATRKTSTRQKDRKVISLLVPGALCFVLCFLFANGRSKIVLPGTKH